MEHKSVVFDYELKTNGEYSSTPAVKTSGNGGGGGGGGH